MAYCQELFWSFFEHFITSSKLSKSIWNITVFNCLSKHFKHTLHEHPIRLSHVTIVSDPSTILPQQVHLTSSQLNIITSYYREINIIKNDGTIPHSLWTHYNISQPTCQEKLDKISFYFDMDFSIVCFHIGVILVIKVNIKPLYGISYNGF